jgi:hypothetical protein
MVNVKWETREEDTKLVLAILCRPKATDETPSCCYR